YLGICLGMQLATVEFARNVVGLQDAHSAELNPNTPYPIIDLLPEQKDIEDLGGTLRLGIYPCKIEEVTIAHKVYREKKVDKRHLHRYNNNNHYREKIEANGMRFFGTSPHGRLVEIVELENHPWFVARQCDPEFISGPTRPQKL